MSPRFWSVLTALFVMFPVARADEDAIPAPAPPAPVEVKSSAVVKVEFAPATPTAAGDRLRTSLADARGVLGETRDYTCHLIRQETMDGKLRPEQVAELLVRSKPFSVSVRLVKPKELFGQETVYTENTLKKVKFKPAGKEGVRGYKVLDGNDSLVLANTKHTLADTGLATVLDAVERTLARDKGHKGTLQVLAEDYTFANRSVLRFEVFDETPAPGRVAYRSVVYFDKETKLPIRYETYGKPQSNGTSGELLEIQSFIGIKRNQGFGNREFER